MIECRVCGARNEAEARFCGTCGNPLSGERAAARSIEARQPTKGVPAVPPRPRASDQAASRGNGVAATLEPASIQVEPGGTAKAQVRVVNVSRVVDEFTVEVLGDAADWATVEPARISLFPGATGTIAIQLRPPRTMRARAGTLALTVRVRSDDDAAREVYSHGVIRVGAFEAISATLVPRTSTGSRGAVHELVVENQGNSLVELDISASDPDRKLEFGIPYQTIALEAGQQTVVPVTVRPRTTFLRGNPTTNPFQVVLDPRRGTRITADASFAQQAVLPSWTDRAISAAVALLAVVIVAAVGPGFIRNLVATAPGSPTSSVAVASTPPPAATTPGGTPVTSAPGVTPTAAPPTAAPTPTPSPSPSPTPTPSPTPSPSPSPTETVTPGPFLVGDYLCLDLANAQAQIQAEGLEVGFVSPPDANDLWLVQEQDPPPGSAATPGTVVNLVASDPSISCVRPTPTPTPPPTPEPTP